MKKLIAFVLVLVMCLALFAGCGSNPTADNGTKAEQGAQAEQSGQKNTANDGKRTKVSAVVISLDSLDPYLVKGSITQGFLNYEPLWTMNEANDEMLGVIAKDWTIDENVIDVTIYDYVYDSAGNHITADDVVWSWNHYVEVGVNANAKYIVSVEKTGDYSVHIVLTVKPWDTLLTTMRVPIVSQKAYEDPNNDFVANPVATGHYVCTQFVAANKAVFEKREHHWQSDVNEDLVPYTYKANVDVVELQCVLETPQIQNGLETGELQCGAVTATIAEGWEGNPDVTVTALPGKYMHTIMLNCYDGLLADNKDLRMAILYAIDTEAIAQAVTKGTGHMSYTIGDESLTGYLPEFEQMDYFQQDLDKAKEYMAAAGYPDGGITLKWLGKSEEAVQLTSTVIQAQLAQIGINLEISNLDNTTYMAQRVIYGENSDWDLCWGDSVPKGNYVLAYQSYIDYTQYEKGNMVGLKDDNMQDIFMTALYDQTPENILALHNVVKDSASIVGSYVDFDFWGHDPNLTVVVGNDGEIAPNAFILSENYDVYAD